MWRVLRKSLIRTSENACTIVKDSKRYAGHSKWANIKHIKAEKDGERAVLFAKLARQMQVAITDHGSWKPTENLRLAQVIEQAKKKSMPMATINAVLDRASKSTLKSQSGTVDIRGPGGCIMVIEVHSDNLKATRITLNTTFKRFNATVIDQSGRHVFNHKGFIIAELMGNLDSATEDAITVGAEDVEEIVEDGEKRLQFTCEPQSLAKVVNQLGGLKYKVISSEDRFLPHIYATLNEAEIDKVSALCDRLESLTEVVRIHDNIA